MKIWALAFCLSIGAHLTLAIGIKGNEAAPIPQGEPRQTPDIEQAYSAFEALDAKRRLDAVEDTLAKNLQSLDVPEIPLLATPPDRPKVKAQAQASQAPKSELPTPKTKASGKTSAPVKAAKGASKADIQNAVQSFGAKVHSALVQSYKRQKLPRGLKSAQAKVTLVFNNGRLAKISLARSSGSAEFDKVVINAAKKAKYPSAPSALPSSQSYSIGLDIGT